MRVMVAVSALITLTCAVQNSHTDQAQWGLACVCCGVRERLGRRQVQRCALESNVKASITSRWTQRLIYKL